MDGNEIIVSLTLGHEGAGERILTRLTRKSSEALKLVSGAEVYAQVKAAALGAAEDRPEE